jgi:Mrp family chromosome partitioning ATPase
VDGVVLVVAADRTRRHDLAAAVALLARSELALVGVVLNHP